VSAAFRFVGPFGQRLFLAPKASRSGKTISFDPSALDKLQQECQSDHVRSESRRLVKPFNITQWGRDEARDKIGTGGVEWMNARILGLLAVGALAASLSAHARLASAEYFFGPMDSVRNKMGSDFLFSGASWSHAVGDARLRQVDRSS
jgi:hypothetical protein